MEKSSDVFGDIIFVSEAKHKTVKQNWDIRETIFLLTETVDDKKELKNAENAFD